MQRQVGGLLAFGVMLSIVGPGRADDQAECRAIVAKGIKAIGGEEKLSKYKAATWKETGTYHGMGTPLPYTGKYAVQWPDQFRMEIEGVFTIVLNGDKAWVKTEGGEVNELPKDKLSETKEGHYAGWVTTLLPLKDKAFQLAPLGGSKVGDRPAVGVKVSSEGHRDVRLYFDKDSGLLIKSESRAKDDMTNKEVEQEAIYSDYRDVGGLKRPMKITIKRDGKLYVEAENTELKDLEKLDDSVFAKP